METSEFVHAARCARFLRWESLSAEMQKFIRNNAYLVAGQMPYCAALSLFERLGLEPPSGFTGSDKIEGRFGAWRERALLAHDLKNGKGM